MKSLNNFIESFINLELIDETNCYGHYPFQMFVENEDNTNQINSLALGGDVASCYRLFAKNKNNNAKRIYFSLDFPSGGDIENYFVCVISYENNEINLIAIPYNVNTGERFDIIEESTHLSEIKNQLMFYVNR